jgi:outer membrane receptor for ferrienterochelin and colicins
MAAVSAVIPASTRCLLLAAAGVLGPAMAQQATPQVDVTGKAADYDARRDDTAMKLVVARADIARYGDTALPDVLKRIPGVTVVNTGRSVEVRMRGLGSGYTQILLDGQRTPPGFALEDLAPDTVERIEVMRAPTAEFSTQAVAGTINIVLRSARKARLKPKREAKLGYLAGGDFKGPSATLDLSGNVDGDEKRGAYSLAANVNHESFDRHFSGFQDNTRPDGSVDLLRRTGVAEDGHINRYSINPKLEWTLDGGDTLSWQTLVNGNRFRNHAHARVDTAIGAPPQVPDLRSTVASENATLKSDLRWTHAFDAATKLEATAGIEGSHQDNEGTGIGADAAGLPATDQRTRLKGRERGVASTGKLTKSLDGGHVLAAGWDGGVRWRDETRTERDAVRPLPPTLPPTLPADEVSDGRLVRLALYAQDEWTIDKAWSVYLGARWEGIRTDAAGNTFAATRVHSSVWSPIAQVLRKVPGSKGDQLRLALSRTYKAPELASLLPRRQTWENNDATEADYLGNPRLQPELAWGVDAAWEHYWAEGAMASLSTSWRRIGNYTGNRVYFDGYRWVFTPENVGRAESRSLELDTKFPIKALALDVRANVARNWSRVDAVPGPDNRMEQQIPLTANVGLDWKGKAWSAGGSVAFRAAAPVTSGIDRATYLPARRDLEAYAVWKAAPKVQLRLALQNILREDDGFEVKYIDPVAGVQKRRWTYPGEVKLRTTLETAF